MSHLVHPPTSIAHSNKELGATRRGRGRLSKRKHLVRRLYLRGAFKIAIAPLDCYRVQLLPIFTFTKLMHYLHEEEATKCCQAHTCCKHKYIETLPQERRYSTPTNPPNA